MVRVVETEQSDDGLGYAPHGGRDLDKRESYAESEAPRAEKSAGRGAAEPAAPQASASPPPSALADEASGAPAPRRRPGLGTEFGEAMSSPVREVGFTRANATRPAAVLGVRYNDRDGLVALGIDVDGCCAGADDLAWRQTATPFPGSDHRYAAPPSGWRDGCCVRY